MITIEKTDVYGWEAAIRGMRNPKNSWDKSDSCYTTRCFGCGAVSDYVIGENDLKLMKSLSKAGSDHGKFLRFINVTVDITAPLYWWKEFDTYKVGTVANSCSTMHKIHAKEFELSDFSCEHLINPTFSKHNPLKVLNATIEELNYWRDAYIKTVNNDIDAPIWMIDGKEATAKDLWWQMIQLLPSSYNQKRTIHLNYEVLVGMYKDRKDHKLDEWHVLCDWIKTLPYSEIITGDYDFLK